MPFNPWVGCQPCELNTAPCSLDNQRNMFNYEQIPCSTPNVTQRACNQNMSGNVAQWGQYNVGDYLLAMQGKLLPMYKTFQQSYSTVSKFLFDYVTDIQDGKPMTRLAIKAIPQISLAPFLNGNFVTWGEYNFRPVDFVISEDPAIPAPVVGFSFFAAYMTDPAVTLTGVQINGINAIGADYSTGGQGFLSVGDTILIYSTAEWNDDTQQRECNPDNCCSTVIQKTIIDIHPVTGLVTLESCIGEDDPAFCPGDRIVRLYKSRNDGDRITNSFGILPNTAKRSYLQHFGYTVNFAKGELNMAYASENGVKDFIANRMFHSNLAMMREVAFAFYRGRNRGQAYGGGVFGPATINPQSTETQGLITGILDANMRNPQLDLVRSMHNLITDDDRVRHILNSILAVQNSGFNRPGQKVTMVCNQHAITALLKMNSAWNRFTGVTVNTNDNTNKDFGLPIIRTPSGDIEFTNCELLTEMYPDEGVIIYGFRDLISAVTRENQKIQFESGGVNKASVGFNFVETTLPGQQGSGHEYHTYDVFTEFAIIIAGFDAGAWRMDLGLLV